MPKYALIDSGNNVTAIVVCVDTAMITTLELLTIYNAVSSIDATGKRVGMGLKWDSGLGDFV